MLIQFAVRNLGIAQVVSDFAKEHLENGELFELTFDRPIPKRKICIVENEKLPRSAAAQALLTFIKEEENKKRT